ncbi:hypothetical protein [Promicromonospora sukumoe]|uniref:hypothetical protein n=1 Tax=Promicromonospora sukumoe TaxID=88382 RepID=UPI0036488BDB
MNLALKMMTTITMTAAVLVAGNVAAVADEFDPGLRDASREVPSIQITLDSAGGRASTSGIPSDCYGDTFNPHYSPKTGMASVHGRTWCEFATPALSVETKLYRDDWWGWNLMATDYSSRTNSRTSYDASPHADCGDAPKRLYRGYSTHTVKLASATATGATSNNHSFVCG